MLPRFRKDFLDARKLLERYQAWNHATTADLQLARLRDVWADCIRDVPYYAGLVERGEVPVEIRTWEDFRAIPELNREILQTRKAEFVRRSGPPDLTRMTGGSTGNPVHFGVWHREDRLIRLLKLTLWMRAGYQPGHHLFLIWGHSHLLGTGWRRHLNHLKRTIKDQLLGYRRVDAYRLDSDRYRSIATSLVRFRPAGLIAYAAALDSFVRANASQTEQFRALGLRFVMPCAEPPPKHDSLDLLRNTFGCPVVQEFGGVDFGQVASRFDDEPFVVFPDQNIVEAMPVNPEEDGDAVVLTSLYPRYLPLIRYRQGDVIAGITRDSHGHVRSFQSLEGRINDMIRLASGGEIHSVAIFHCIHQEPEILNIQMVLEDAGPRLSLATLAGAISPAVEARIRHRLGQIAGELASIPITAVPDLETTRAGKRRWFVDKRTTPPSAPIRSLMRVTIIFDNFGPYHVARVEAASRLIEITGIELRAKSRTYAWQAKAGAKLCKVTLPAVAGHGRIERASLTPHLERALADSRPDVVAVNGWGDFLAAQSIRWCVRNRVPVVLLSESSALDGHSLRLHTAVKRRLIGMASAALVGGIPHRDHVISLGMSPDRVFTGYNVVDNATFTAAAEYWRKVGEETQDCTTQDAREEGDGDRGLGAGMTAVPGVLTRGGTPRETDWRETRQPQCASHDPPSAIHDHQSTISDPRSTITPYFLASNRFIERKNLARLVDAYAEYIRQSSISNLQSPTWNLCLLGDGELKGALIAQCMRLGLTVIEAAPWEAVEKEGSDGLGRTLTAPEGEALMEGKFCCDSLASTLTDRRYNADHLPQAACRKPHAAGPVPPAVFFPSFRQMGELPRFYAHAGAFVHPALVEPWGLVVNEAMACGLPVLVSNRCGCCADLVVDGTNGYAFDPLNVGQLVALLSKVADFDFPRSTFGRESLRTIGAWSPERFASGLQASVERASDCGPARPSMTDRLLLEVLGMVR